MTQNLLVLYKHIGQSKGQQVTKNDTSRNWNSQADFSTTETSSDL